MNSSRKYNNKNDASVGVRQSKVYRFNKFINAIKRK